MPIAPDSSNSIVSTLNVENVVNEPMNPVPTAVTTLGESRPDRNKKCVSQPSAKLPDKLMSSVPSGNIPTQNVSMPVPIP